jgi:hypothetical protein
LRLVAPASQLDERHVLDTYLEAHREQYLAGLRGLGSPGGWNRWIELFLRALVEQAETNAKTDRGLLQLYECLKTQIIELTYSYGLGNDITVSATKLKNCLRYRSLDLDASTE